MREAIGGSWLMYIFIVFLFTIILLLVFAINYLSAYRLNDEIVSCIEQKEGYTNECKTVAETSKNYTANNRAPEVTCTEGHYTGLSSNGSVYDVKTFITFNFPLLNIKINIPLRNKSRSIYGVSCVGA